MVDQNTGNETEAGDDDLNVDSLSQFVSAIYGAVKRAQVAVQANAQQKFDYFFPESGNGGTRVPRTVSVPFPQKDGGHAIQEVPLFALVPHHDLMVDEVNVRMKLSLLSLLGKQEYADLEAKLPSGGTSPDLIADIEIRLKGVDPVEGVARINDAIVKRI